MNLRRTRKTPKPWLLNWSGCTNTGKVRKNNEDAFLGLQFDSREVRLLGRLGGEPTEKFDYAFAVCDGMGGAKSGEFASQIAVERITRLLPHAYRQSAQGLNPGCADVLSELFTQIHRALVFVGGSYEETDGMQTTLSLCWFTPGWMYFGHIGDSRIYHLPKRKSQIMQVTQDDTHVGWLLRNGQISEHEARTHPRRNVLQRALGGANQFVDPQTGAVAYERGDIFLLCTDGLVDGLYDHQLIDLLRQKKTENLAQQIVESSIKNSGRDNTTALVIRIV
jgi:serine/threonine protein phosphatase PrpC